MSGDGVLSLYSEKVSCDVISDIYDVIVDFYKALKILQKKF